MINFEKTHINFAESHQFSSLFIAYEENKFGIDQFYDVHYKDINGILPKIKSISNEFKNRDVIRKYVAGLAPSKDASVNNNRNLLLKENTLTVCTGHQLCLLTGPLYFIYKILSTIKLAEYYSKHFTDFHFVPVYWMAGEDNDKDEVNHFHAFHESFFWETPQKGPVGKFNLEGLSEVFSKFFDSIGNHETNKQQIQALIETTIKASISLSDFTYNLVSEIFKGKGLIILNPDNADFKKSFISFIKADIFDQINYNPILSTIHKLEKKSLIKPGKAQVNPREINFFYLNEQYRERIIFEDDVYFTVDQLYKWTKQEMNDEIDQFPEKFSPNVVTRPLYQQSVLPNLAYVGGPGEIAYWLEYMDAFKVNNLQMPLLVPRKFIYVIEKTFKEKMDKLEIDVLSLFQMSIDELKNHWVSNKNTDQLDLSNFQLHFNELFDQIHDKVMHIDKTLSSYLEAERTKVNGFLQNLETKTLRSLKRNEETNLHQIEKLKNRLFPNQIPQERYYNIFNFLLKYNFDFMEILCESIDFDEDGVIILTEK